MESHNHSLECLFKQLGLDSTDTDIEKFILQNTPISGTTELHQAKFWTPSQAAFLKQAKEDDADWAEIVDQLNSMLHLLPGPSQT